MDSHMGQALELVRQLANEVEGEVRSHYNWPDVHPALIHKYERDMSTVFKARDFLYELGEVELSG